MKKYFQFLYFLCFKIEFSPSYDRKIHMYPITNAQQTLYISVVSIITTYYTTSINFTVFKIDN